MGVDVRVNLLSRTALVARNFKQLLIQVTCQASLFDPKHEMSWGESEPGHRRWPNKITNKTNVGG